MCVFLVCVLVLFRASVCAFRVSELLVVRLSFVVKLFRLCSWFRSFRVEFWIRVSLSNLSSNFRFRFRVQVPWIFVSNFEFAFFVSLLYSTSRISLLYSISRIWLWIRRRIRLLEFRVEFQIRICRRNLSSKFSFRCSIRLLEARVFDSNFEFAFFVSLLYSISRISFWIRRQIRLLEIDRQIRLLEVRLLDSSALNFEFVLIYSTSRISICDFDSKLWWSSSSRIVVLEVVFFIWVLNWTLQFSSKFDDYQCYCELTSSIILARSLSLRSRCHASFARAFRA